MKHRPGVALTLYISLLDTTFIHKHAQPVIDSTNTLSQGVGWMDKAKSHDLFPHVSDSCR